jgi:lipoprotein NlpI
MLRLSCFILCFILSGCTAFTRDTQSQPSAESESSSSMANLIIPEPERASIRAQQALAKFNLVMMSSELADEERAQFLFRRGLLFDSVGLDGLAFFDFQRALRTDPMLHQAYNSLGVHHTLRGEFIEAYEAFDAVLEMDPEYEFAYLNRGMALYYGGRYNLAMSDIKQYYDNDPQDAYRLLWTYIVAVKVNKMSAMEELAEQRKLITKDQWSNNIIDFYLGKISQKALLDSVVMGIDTRNQMNERLCEAYFYLGKYYRALGQMRVATNFFKLALATNVFEFVEYRFARAEIAAIRDSSR